MRVVSTPHIIRDIFVNYLLRSLMMAQLQKMDAKISTKPTRIWSRYTLMPILSRLKIVPS